MKNRQKPNSSRSFAGTGEAPISIDGEARLDKAISENTVENEKRISILEEENQKLQIRVDANKVELDAAADAAKILAKEALVAEKAAEAADKAAAEAFKELKALEDKIDEEGNEVAK